MRYDTALNSLIGRPAKTKTPRNNAQGRPEKNGENWDGQIEMPHPARFDFQNTLRIPEISLRLPPYRWVSIGWRNILSFGRFLD
jgi:hypothetical protein